MAIKLKKSRPFLSWLCVPLALCLFIFAGLSAEHFLNSTAFADNYTSTYDFTYRVENVLYSMLSFFKSDAEITAYYDEYGETLTLCEARQYYLNDCGYGYYIRMGDKYFSNLNISDISEFEDENSDDWGYMLKLEDGIYSGYSENTDFPGMEISQIRQIDYDYSTELRPYCVPARDIAREIAELGEDVEFVLLLPGARMDSWFTESSDAATTSYKNWIVSRLEVTVWATAVLLGLVLTLTAIIRRKDIMLFERKAAQLQSRIIIEIKVAVDILIVCLAFMVYDNNDEIEVVLCFVALFLMAIWLTFCDIRYNGKNSFRFNVIGVIIRYLKNHDEMLPLQKRMMSIVRRIFVCGCLLCLLGGLFSFVGGMANEYVLLIFGLVLAYAGVVVLCLGVDRYRSIVMDIGALCSQTQAIRSGELNVQQSCVYSDDLKELADSINCIQDGMKSAVERQLSSERMKVELITNVSHDLKTPLTAITNYVGLLDMEQLEPPEANDYVDILAQKTSRLTMLISDLFEVSKATSGTMDLNMEPIDVFALTEQTLAELEDRIITSGVSVRMTHPDKKPWVMADGRRLYRVFENVIGNAVKYSLAGTRIYIDIACGSELTSVTVRNIANYEMDFEPQEMLERFVRADKSRTAEGSGLGLSIAKSFTELMDGKFNISVDGDVFRVSMVFRPTNPPDESEDEIADTE